MSDNDYSQLGRASRDCPLLSDGLPQDPVILCQQWLQQAIDSKVIQASAMVLSTVDSEQRPSARVVLLKAISDGEFVFFTNYNSHKGQDLLVNPNGSLLFYWPSLERQIRIEGQVHKIPPEMSQQYFVSRPRESQLGAWASPQSEVVANRQVLEQAYQALEHQYKDQDVPYPEHWGGYALKPDQIEFWQCRSNRLHDRFQYRCQTNNQWEICRLAP